MASTASLREHLVDELNDLVNAEQQLIVALPQMEEEASRRELKAAFRSYLAETRTHVKRASQALELLGEEVDGKVCEAMEGLIEEGQDLMEGADAGALRDAMLITAAQKVEHYEIASYGTARTYAEVLGERGVAKLLAQTLKEEKAADKKLTTIAEGSVNECAAEEWHEQSEGGMLAKGVEWVGETAGGVMNTMGRSKSGERRSHAADRTPKKRGRSNGTSRSSNRSRSRRSR